MDVTIIIITESVKLVFSLLLFFFLSMKRLGLFFDHTSLTKYETLVLRDVKSKSLICQSRRIHHVEVDEGIGPRHLLITWLFFSSLRVLYCIFSLSLLFAAVAPKSSWGHSFISSSIIIIPFSNLLSPLLYIYIFLFLSLLLLALDLTVLCVYVECYSRVDSPLGTRRQQIIVPANHSLGPSFLLLYILNHIFFPLSLSLSTSIYPLYVCVCLLSSFVLVRTFFYACVLNLDV